MPEILDALVIGAGWAGLGVSHALTTLGLSHRVLERGRIAETWRSQRWDSFHMNTPNLQTVMPGDSYGGPDPEGFLSRDDFVALLENFAARHALPVDRDTPVTALTAGPDGTYHITTPRFSLAARAVAVASGSLSRPRRPPGAAALPAALTQIDASAYRNAAALPDGAVLVVGNAQSGGQIAEDLVEAGRDVYLSTGQVGRVPRRYRGRDISVWLVLSGLFDAPRAAFVQPDGRIAARPLLGALHTISLQSLSAQGVTLLGRFTGVSDGQLQFGDDLAANLHFADEASATAKRHIDDYVASAGLDAPQAEPDPAETVSPRLPDPPLRGVEAGRLGAVVWCTGFDGDFGWIRLPGALDARGRPIHSDGISPLPGLCFAGLDLAKTRRSGTILAISEEAPRLAGYLAASRPSR